MQLVSRKTAIAGLALFAAVVAPASAGAGDKATGGGQVLIASDGRGPGDTITFTAQQRADGTVHGNVNVIDRVQDSGTGQGFHFRGDVTCVEAVGNTAKIAGTGEGPDGTTGFTLIVVDNGEGSAADDDTITLQYTNDPTCDRQNGDNDDAVDLARGNAQVTDGG
jgi:hypothetical protein